MDEFKIGMPVRNNRINRAGRINYFGTTDGPNAQKLISVDTDSFYFWLHNEIEVLTEQQFLQEQLKGTTNKITREESIEYEERGLRAWII